MIKSYKKLFISLSFIGLLLAPSISLAATKFPIDTGGTLTTGLVSYYKLGDTTDFYGSNNGTNSGVTFTTGKINNGGSFNGSSQIQLPTGGYISATGYSITAWIKTSSTGSIKAIVSKDIGGGTVTSRNWQFRIEDTNKVGIARFSGTNTYTAVSTGTVTDNNWHHVAFVFSSSFGSKIYIDGAQDGSDANTGNNNVATGDNPYIGADFTGGVLNNRFNGLIDEVGIWNRALSTTEISDLYNGGNGQTMCTIGSDCPSGTTNPQMQIMWIDEY